MKTLSTAIIIGALTSAGVSQAATDGTLGSTSTGSLNLSMQSIAAPVSEAQITGLQDISFGNVTEGTIALPQTINNICVYLSTATTYSVAISSLNSPSPGLGQLQYRSVSGSGADVNYTWSYQVTGISVTGASGNGLIGDDTEAAQAPAARM